MPAEHKERTPTASGTATPALTSLRAPAPTKPVEPSSYLPTSRRFGNPIYLHVEAITGAAELPERDQCAGCARTCSGGPAAL